MCMSEAIMAMPNMFGMEKVSYWRVQNNIKANDLKRIERAIHENADIIINRWYEIFKTEDDENQ